MSISVSIERPQDTHSLDVFNEIMEQKDKLTESGIVVSEKKSKNFSPELSGALFISVATGVASAVTVSMVESFMEYIMEKIKKKKYYSVKLIFKHNEYEFQLPSKKKECLDYFANLEEEEKSE